MQDFPTPVNSYTKDKKEQESEIFSGFLSHVQLNDFDKDTLLLALRSKYKTYLFDFLAHLLSTDDFLQFLDVFAGDTLNIPSRDDFYSYLSDVQIYGFIERKKTAQHRETAETPDFLIQSASMAFGKSKLQVQKSNSRVQKLIGSLEGSTLLDLNSLKSRKKVLKTEEATIPKVSEIVAPKDVDLG